MSSAARKRKPTTLDSLRAHAPITSVLLEVVGQVRKDAKLNGELDAALSSADPSLDNVRVRWLQKRQAYEVTLVLDAAPWRIEEAESNG